MAVPKRLDEWKRGQHKQWNESPRAPADLARKHPAQQRTRACCGEDVDCHPYEPRRWIRKERKWDEQEGIVGRIPPRGDGVAEYNAVPLGQRLLKRFDGREVVQLRTAPFTDERARRVERQEVMTRGFQRELLVGGNERVSDNERRDEQGKSNPAAPKAIAQRVRG